MKQIIFATGNAGKMKEIREILNQGGGHPKLVSGKRDSGLQRDFGGRNYCAGG